MNINKTHLFDLTFKYDGYFYVKNRDILHTIEIRIRNEPSKDNQLILQQIFVLRNINSIIDTFITTNDIEYLDYITFLMGYI